MIVVLCDLCRRSLGPEEPYYLLSVSYVDEETEENILLGGEVERPLFFHICERCYNKKLEEVLR